jgi:nucleoprotein TPR
MKLTLSDGHTAENKRSLLESELQTLKSSSTTSTSEVETLRARIATLEASNRDTLAVLESKSTANDELAKDLQKQHQKGLELSQQITSLQQSAQNANSAASSAKFREQSLKQEVELAKRNNEWFENELKTKSAEALKYRKEKGTRISELQRLNEEATSNIEALKRTEQALRSRLDEIQKKAEDSLSKVQQLQEAAAKTEDGFRQELESARRLAELQAQQTETHRNRLREVEASLEKAKDDAAEQVGRCQQEVDAERQEREQAEHRIAELESEVDRLEALASTQNRPGSMPGTPRQGSNSSFYGRPGSPAQFGTPGPRNKSTITATQALEDLYKVKLELTAERRESKRLKAELDDMIQQLEAKSPELEEIQSEHDRLQLEVVEMSKFIDQTGKERDRAKKDARKAESEASTAQAEIKILRQQLRDLSAQIKMLLCEIDARERGLDALSTAERSHLERLARGEVDEDSFEGLTDTDRFISQRLTVFRNITELQEKNEELLKITRQLGAQMESEEALAAKHQAAQDHAEVQNLQLKIEKYKDELQSMTTRSESYIKERDMFRRMLQHRGQLPPTSDLASIFGQSIDGNQNGIFNTIEPNLSASTSYPVVLRELQAQFDHYREEQTIDRRTMKDQIEKLSLEKSSLQAEIAKLNSQVTLTLERHDLIQSNYKMVQNENVELQKRSQTLSEASAKQDLRTQQVAEDLVEAKGLVESMRNEISNLKAEKKLWKDIQERLSQDNEALTNERSRLNTLVANQQTLQNERELSESETRRRLQARVESLEAELSTTKRKLSDEVEENKNTQLRKEYDAQQHQRRIDELTSSLSQIREELVAVKTTRDHLQSRVDELTIELKSAEERVELLQPRPTPRPSINGNTPTGAVDNHADGELAKEQELAIEISELKRDLELVKSELEGANAQMEQYKSISQSSEEGLQSLIATQDQYQEEMNQVIEEKDSKIRELQQRADDISAELTNTNNELTSLRTQHGEIARRAEEEKAMLESEISRLKDDDERHATAAQFHQQDLRAQAAIATKAQQDYENELVKHAEAAKLLQTLRGEHNQLKTESATLRAVAESAKLALSQSENSWEERRGQFEGELKELRTRRDDLNSQNKLLHQQLENVGSQITALQQNRSTPAESLDTSSPTADSVIDRTSDGLRELNAFLRREKEIVEVQYELKIQEAKRLQQQFDYSQSQLDETRLKLDQERRQSSSLNHNVATQKELLEKLNELNIYRESATTLRNEAAQARNSLAEKTKRVEELLEQIQPLETKIRELEHGKETLEGEKRLLQEDRDRWQKRTQDIISKYDRIDPVEMEQLKESKAVLQAEVESLKEERQPLEEKIQVLEGEKATWQQTRQKLIDQAKERNRINTNQIKERTAEKDAALQEKESLQQQLSSLQQDLEAAVREKDSAEQHVASVGQELEMIKSERDRALAHATTILSQPPHTQAVIQEAEETGDQKLAELSQELDAVKQEKRALEAQLDELREQLHRANSERDNAIAEAKDAKSQHTASSNGANGNEDGQINESSTSGLSDDERKGLEERIAVAEARAKEQQDKAASIEAQMENTLKARSDKMKAALNKRLVESKETQRTELEAEYKLKLEQEKQIWLAESKTLERVPRTPAKLTTEQPKVMEETAPATPVTPSLPPLSGSSAVTMSEKEVRDIIQYNPTAQAIMKGNIVKKAALETQKETQKLKDEHAKLIVELQQKAEATKVQAVHMETKKSALKLNITENKVRIATGKLDIISKAALETPQRPVVEVWDEAKNFKPSPQAPAAVVPPPLVAVAPVTQQNDIHPGTELPEIKSEGPSIIANQAPPQQSNINSGANGNPIAPSGIPVVSSGHIYVPRLVLTVL